MILKENCLQNLLGFRLVPLLEAVKILVPKVIWIKICATIKTNIRKSREQSSQNWPKMLNKDLMSIWRKQCLKLKKALWTRKVFLKTIQYLSKWGSRIRLWKQKRKISYVSRALLTRCNIQLQSAIVVWHLTSLLTKFRVDFLEQIRKDKKKRQLLLTQISYYLWLAWTRAHRIIKIGIRVRVRVRLEIRGLSTVRNPKGNHWRQMDVRRVKISRWITMRAVHLFRLTFWRLYGFKLVPKMMNNLLKRLTWISSTSKRLKSLKQFNNSFYRLKVRTMPRKKFKI